MHKINPVDPLTEASGLEQKFYKEIKYYGNLSLKLFHKICKIRI